MKVSVHIRQSRQGEYVATCPMLPGCISRGTTREQAQANMGQAILGYLASVSECIAETIVEQVVVETGV